MHRGCRGRSHCGNGSRHYGREDLRQKKLGHGYCGVGRRDNSQAAAAGEETKHTAAAADATATATLRRCPRGRPSQPDALRADHPKNTARPATMAVAKSSGCLSKRRRWWRWRCSKKKKKKRPTRSKVRLTHNHSKQSASTGGSMATHTAKSADRRRPMQGQQPGDDVIRARNTTRPSHL